MQNIFCVWEFKGRMFENFNFGKIGFTTCVLEKHFISYSCILFIIFNALRSFFKNQIIFFLKCCFYYFYFYFYFYLLFFFSKFRLIQYIFRSIEIVFKIFCEPLSISINQNWFSINRKWIRFLKNQIWLVQTIFFKTFFSLSNLTRLHKDFFLSFSSKFLARFLSP